MKTSAKRQKVNALNKSLIKHDEGINNTQLYLISHDNIFRDWTQNLIDGPLQASLNFIRLLRVVITPSVEKTTRSSRMNFRLITGMKRMDFKSYIPSFWRLPFWDHTLSQCSLQAYSKLLQKRNPRQSPANGPRSLLFVSNVVEHPAHWGKDDH